MSIVRLATPSPRKGFLALLDGATFDKSTLPPLPESLTGFTVMSMDLKATLDKLETLSKQASPDANRDFKAAVDSVQAKTKVRLREDILAHLGPQGGLVHLANQGGWPGRRRAGNDGNDDGRDGTRIDSQAGDRPRCR